MKKDIKSILKDKSIVRLDVGCGENKNKGFVGIDYRDLEGVDIVHNLEEFPWPLPDESIDFVVSSHVVEHINPHGGTFIKFMDEVWRVLKPGAEFMIACPHGASPGFLQDPTHCNAINETTWEYFDPLAKLSGGMLYKIYKPRPWEIKEGCNYVNPNGNLEVVLIKRRLDPSYEK